MTGNLPNNPSLENLQKQAKSLLKQVRASDAEAIRRLQSGASSSHAQKGSGSASEVIKLADCQRALAREHGFPSWAEMKRAVELANLELSDQFLKFATLTYGDNFHTDIDQANELLEAHPGLATQSIWTAVAAGQAESVAKLLAEKPSFANEKGGPLKWEPLLYLCYSRAHTTGSDALATAKALLKYGADPNARFTTHGTYVFTCVTGAIGEGENGPAMCPPHRQARELVTLLLDDGANPNDGQGLYNSMFTGGTHWLELLLRYGLKQGDSINWAEKDGITTLDYLLAHAAKKNMVDRVDLLLKHDADPNCIDSYDKKPCYELALAAGNTRVVELLTEYGATPVEPKTDKQKFYNACMAENRESVSQMRTDQPRNVEKWIASNFQLVGQAVGANKLDVVRYLLELGFPIGDALFDAAWHGRLEMARLLIEFGASSRKRHNIHGVTPIAFADRAGHSQVVEYLLKQDIDIFDAVRFGNPNLVEQVLEKEPDSLERKYRSFGGKGDWMLHTPLIHAVSLGRVAIAKLLIDNGADKSVRLKGESLHELAKSSENNDLATLFVD